MSAHAGLLFTDGRPVAEEAIDTLSRVNSLLGPDRTGRYIAPGLALLSYSSHFDQLSVEELQPVCTTDGSVLVWDGRLDNREDFICRLQSELADDRSDARLMALALVKWPTTALEGAIGDWSLAYWNHQRRELLLARDYSGTRALYYSWRRDSFAWSTRIEPLVDVCGLAGQINEAYLAGSLTFGAPDNHTCYRGVFQVPAGYALRVRPGDEPSCLRFIRFSERSLHYADPLQYEQHYRSLLTEAVRVRLRARQPVWAELSGGYDSSAIVCVGNSLVRAGLVETKELQPISVVAPDSPESDESRYIDCVDDFCSLRSIRLRLRPSLEFRTASTTSRTSQYSHNPNDRAVVVEEAGSHVLLSGEFGDSITDPYSVHDILADHFMAWRFGACLAESVQYGRVSKTSLIELWRPLIQSLWRTDSAEDARMAFINTMAGVRHKRHSNVTSLFGIREDFLRRALGSPESNDSLPMTVPRVKRSFLRCVLGFAPRYGRDSFRRPSCAQTTFPFLHRPLVEFILAAPPVALWSHTSHRSFVCRALRDILPQPILNRRNKGYAAPAIGRGLTHIVASALADVEQLLLVQGGYADPAALAELFRGFLDGSEGTSVHMTRILGAERLLRRLRSEAARLPQTPPQQQANSARMAVCATAEHRPH